MLLCWKAVKSSEHLYPTISRNHSGVHSDCTRSVHVLTFELIPDAIRMQDFGHIWIIHLILELRVESTPLEAHGLKVGEIGI